ncbi:MAG: transposase [Deltaproteobacteria bacterium]|nr:transposase [Deltaproteobacteria bacterium]
MRAPLQQASRGLVAEVGGFNRHAGVRVAADDRDGLERLCRYMARPAVASGRVRVLPDGNVVYRVKSPRSAGATHRVMTPMEFMARLSALVAPPRTPLVRYQGVLAPELAVAGGGGSAAAAGRRVAVGSGRTGGGAAGGRGPREDSSGDGDGAGRSRRRGADADTERANRLGALMWRVWAVDVLLCPGCSGRMKMIAALTERAAIVRILEHLDVSIEVPRMRRSRDGP